MGRPSVLTEPMKADIAKQLAEGVPIREVARRFKVGEATLRRNFSAQIPIVREVAQGLAKAEADLARLPVSAQRAARSLADQLRAISDNLAAAALAGSATAARLAEAAYQKAQEIDPETGEGMDKVPHVFALTETANKAAAPALTLVAAQAKAQAPPSEVFDPDTAAKMLAYQKGTR